MVMGCVAVLVPGGVGLGCCGGVFRWWQRHVVLAVRVASPGGWQEHEVNNGGLGRCCGGGEGSCLVWEELGCWGAAGGAPLM